MSLPFFYASHFSSQGPDLTLDEATSLHVVQVLRMIEGEDLLLTNGKGELLTTKIVNAHKKATGVHVMSQTAIAPPAKKIKVAISLIKNTSRFEWFLEKATEIGVSDIIPLICARTEKQHFRFSRMNSILISAMLQSQQAWLPVLHEPVAYEKCLAEFNSPTRLVAHCLPGQKNLLREIAAGPSEVLLLIGPEGDFSANEIVLALQKNFIPVSLGETRLRTETAGIVGVTLLNGLS